MEPKYLSEIRYSYLVGSFRRARSASYIVRNPQGAFEQHLQDLFLEGQKHLRQEEFTIAVHAFEEAMGIVLHTMHPTMPVDPNTFGKFKFPRDAVMVDSLAGKTAELLMQTATTQIAFPPSAVNKTSSLPAAVQEQLKAVTETGLRVTSFHGSVAAEVEAALHAAATNDWKQTASFYLAALDKTPENEAVVRGSILHDLALVSEKARDPERAQAFVRQSIAVLAQTNIADAQAEDFASAAGILSRSGQADAAAEMVRALESIRSTTLLSDILPARELLAGQRSANGTLNLNAATTTASGTAAASVTDSANDFAFNSNAPVLFGTKYLEVAPAQKSLTIRGFAESATIELDAAGAADSTKGFLKTLAETKDLGLLTGWLTPTNFIAYIPHMYFYVLPMSIGDCYAGMGNHQDALDSYIGVLPYPFINKNYEIVKLWTRIAQTYLDLADALYRKAKDNVAAYAGAKALYENIVRADNTLDLVSSPLYADAKFADITGRVTALLAAPDPTAVGDNPEILTLVLQAFAKLNQIAAGLNFFGSALNYVPPFSFEYLQNSARYFAQHASQTEQRYIQYKSQAENEEFHREQLDQQAEVARQSVILEQRGQDEAQLGVDVANASLDYATSQLQNAQASVTDFDTARWELLDLAMIEAWASAASVGQDKEVLLTTHVSDYYTADRQRRSQVLQDLAYQRTLLSHDLEAARLARSVNSATDYQAVATAQVTQAQARVEVARQRVQIAALQQRQAEENRDFLDMREFSARLWYEIAQQAKRLKQRYLDMATEIAFLMERAYNAETERGLSIVRYDYQSTASGNLMGADLLLADIDSFTLDYLTTTKSKKIPVKRVISIADAYPIQFDRLKRLGDCTFETTFADFDRHHPGLYLAKVRNVEVIFVGLSGPQGVAGTLRNVGVSRFRASSGTITERLYPADVMVLSQYEIRQDALAFRFNPQDLRLFENHGIETAWRLALPRDANDLDYSDILDVHLVVYYDGFFDPALEKSVREALPASASAARSLSMQFSALDELFYLKNQGKGDIVFDTWMFPQNQTDLVRSTNTIKLTGRPTAVNGVTVHLVSEVAGGELTFTSDAKGEILDTPAGAPLANLKGKAVLDTWHLEIRAADNPQLVQNGKLDLSGIEDVLVFFEYTFKYR
jgi:hypothetical protein